MTEQDSDWGFGPEQTNPEDRASHHSLDRANKSCHAGREVDRLTSIQEDFETELIAIEGNIEALSLMKQFLTYYQKALDGSENALPDKPWFGFMGMFLELLKGVEGPEDAYLLDHAVRSFLVSAKGVGYVNPKGGGDE